MLWYDLNYISAFKLDYSLEFLFDLQVQAVLLLLGGYEVPTGIPTVGMPSQNQSQRVCKATALSQLCHLLCILLSLSEIWQGSSDLPVRASQPQRAASLTRFREKRKDRCFDKKIRYEVRKEVAIR